MHPDFSLVLQKCASNLSLKHKQPISFSAYVNRKTIMSDTATEVSNNSPDYTEDLVRIVSDEEDEAEEREDELVEEDNISLCSELSVGKENPAAVRQSARMEDEEEVLDISDTHSNSSNEEMQHSLSVTSPDAGLNPFALATTLRFPVPFGLPANAVNTAANISPFQEEFLRKSHLYAEELMKHQMQLMAAARASAFSLRSNALPQLHQASQLTSNPSLVHHLNPLSKIGQLSAAAAAALSAAAQQNHKPINQSPHHAHHLLQQPTLNHHHHQPPHQYSLQNDTLAKLTDLSKQPSPTTPNTAHQMMSTLNQLQTQMQAHLPGLLQDNNDNLHERALKFSIDNILKADFGRTNSLDSPFQLRKTSPQQNKSHSGHKHKLNNNTTTCSASSLNLLNDNVDHGNHNISPTTQNTFSTSLANICTNSNDSNSTAVSSNYSSANGNTGDLIKSSPSQTPTLSPGFSLTPENGTGTGGSSRLHKNSNKTEEPATSTSATGTGSGPIVWPAWVYCTRYSDRPSSGPRVRKPKAPKSTNSATNPAATVTAAGNEKANSPSSSSSANTNEDKRPRTAFSGSQLARLKHEFNENRYLTEKRRQQLSSELGLNEAQIKIWFQNKRAKLKKSSGVKNPLALQLMAQGLYNHSTIPLTREEEELQELQEREKNNNMGNNNNNNSLQQQQPTSTAAVTS